MPLMNEEWMNQLEDIIVISVFVLLYSNKRAAVVGGTVELVTSEN